MPKFILTNLQKQILSTHAENEKPNEACGILFGKENQGRYDVERIFLTQNIEQSPVNFTISAAERLEADKIERESELKIIGIFHSHPESKAYPSKTDKKFMDLNPVVWIILSGISNEFKGYVLESKILEIPVVEE